MAKSLRKIKVRIASKTKTVYRKRKPGKARCGACGRLLGGALRERPYKMRNIAKTKKRPERTYGGVLCSGCVRKKIIDKYIKNV